ncbi:hypothetical protein ANN_14492 [Periplaneta americana]|uniref:Uncharacterized protein n=1 Tax=Periplaneta americana TaxID=6978 RepID=A0ABQ8SXW9_PERAM|nr:hypothetical protein ANN_14492 [Periplaneta americana]
MPLTGRWGRYPVLKDTKQPTRQAPEKCQPIHNRNDATGLYEASASASCPAWRGVEGLLICNLNDVAPDMRTNPWKRIIDEKVLQLRFAVFRFVLIAQSDRFDYILSQHETATLMPTFLERRQLVRNDPGSVPSVWMFPASLHRFDSQGSLRFAQCSEFQCEEYIDILRTAGCWSITFMISFLSQVKYKPPLVFIQATRVRFPARSQFVVDKGDTLEEFFSSTRNLSEVNEEKKKIYEPTIQYLLAKYNIEKLIVTGLFFGARGTIPKTFVK